MGAEPMTFIVSQYAFMLLVKLSLSNSLQTSLKPLFGPTLTGPLNRA